jgi:alpha-1,6-mannosyltransferase
MAGTMERARASAAASPELRFLVERGRSLLYGSDSDDGAPVDPSPWRPTSPHKRVWQTVLCTVSGFLGGLVIAASAPVWRLWDDYVAPDSWRLTVPGIPHPGTATQSTLLFLLGLVLLAVGWLGLVHRAGRIGDKRKRVAMVAVVIAIWAVPVSLGPPLLSNDVYSYIAQGEAVSRGLDPGEAGVFRMGRNDFTTMADPYWRPSAAPYGPVAQATSEAVITVSGHDPVAAIWLYRVVVLIGVAMSAAGVLLIADRSRVNPAVALAIALANPVVILHFIGGIHNDALMLGFMALGLAAAQRDRKKLGVALLIAATAMKLPAALGLVYVGWTWAGPLAAWTRRVATTAAVMATAIVAIVLGCLAVGLGPGWVFALSKTGTVLDTYSPTTKLGYSVSEILGLVGLSVDGSLLAGITRALGLLMTAVLGLVMLLRSPRIGAIRATGIMFVAYVLLGPVIWPWYLPAGFALLAATGLGRWRPSYLIVCIAVSWFVWPTSVMSLEGPGGGDYQHLRGLGVVLLVGALAWGAQRFSTRWERRMRRELDELPSPPESSAEPPVPTPA